MAEYDMNNDLRSKPANDVTTGIIKPAPSPLAINLIGPFGGLSVEVEAPDIDHVWCFMKKHGYLDCVVHGTGKKARVDATVIHAIVEIAVVATLPANAIIHPGLRRQ